MRTKITMISGELREAITVEEARELVADFEYFGKQLGYSHGKYHEDAMLAFNEDKNEWGEFLPVTSFQINSPRGITELMRIFSRYVGNI